MAKKRKNALAEVKTVGQLKKLLENYENGKSLADVHVKLVKPKTWNFTVEVTGAKIYADDVDEAEEEIIRCLKKSGLFPQSLCEITDIDEIDYE